MLKLEKNIRKLREEKDILLISHAVLGYPSFAVCEESICKMSDVGVDIIELQIPFSDPQADGPFFTEAQQRSIEDGTTVEDCFRFAASICSKCPSVNFLFMTYFNILFKYGVKDFVKKAAEVGVKGIIVPDLPTLEAALYVEACREYQVASIFMFTPFTSDSRMREISSMASGFIYCQARAGITGVHTRFDASVERYIERCRAATDLPLAMGFGIQEKADIDFLKGKVDVAICCTQAVKVLAKDGVDAMGDFLAGLVI